MAETSGGLCLLVAILLVNNVYSELPDRRLCGDAECKGTLSIAVINQAYAAQNDQELELHPGEKIRVTSKNIQDDHAYWGGEINGKHGYFPFSHVSEETVLNENPKYVLSTKQKDDNFEDLAKQFAESQASGNANKVETVETTTPSAPDQQPGGGSDGTEASTDGEEEGEEEEEEDEEGADEEGDEEDEEEETEAQSDGTEAVSDPTEAAEGTETKTDDNKADAAAVGSGDAGGGLFSSIGSMIGGMFGGKEAEGKEGAETKEEKKTEEVNETKDQATSANTAPKEEVKTPPPTDPTEAPEPVAAETEEGLDDKLRTIQQEQLAKIRSNFLRRRTPTGSANEDVEDINKLLEKKYKRMEDPPQYRIPRHPTVDGSIPNPETQDLKNSDQLKQQLAAKELEIKDQLEKQKQARQAESDKQMEIQKQNEAVQKAKEQMEREAKARAQLQEIEKMKAEQQHKEELEKMKEIQKQREDELKAQLQAEETRKAQEEAERKRREEEIRLAKEAEEKRKAEEEARKLQEAKEAEEKKKAEEEARKVQEAREAEERKRKAEEEARKLQEAREVEEKKRKAEEEAKKLLEAKEAEERKKKEEEEARKLQEAWEAETKKRKAEEEARKLQEAEENGKKMEEALRIKQEQMRIEEERKKQEAQKLEALQKAEEARKLQEKLKQEERLRQEAEANRVAEEKRRMEEAKRVEEELRAAKLREEQAKQAELQKQKEHQEERLKRQQEQMRTRQEQLLEKERENLARQQQEKAAGDVEPHQHPPLGSTQPGSGPPASPVSIPTTQGDSDLLSSELLNFPHGSTAASIKPGDGQVTAQVQPTAALTQPSPAGTVSAVPEQTAQPTPTQPNVGSNPGAGGGQKEVSAQPVPELLQPSTPTPAQNVRPSEVPPTAETTTMGSGKPQPPPPNQSNTQGAVKGEETEDAVGEADEEEADETETGEDEEDPEAEEESEDANADKEAKPEEAVQPTATAAATEEMEQTITGADGLRSVVFDGTTLPLDDEPVAEPTANLEVSASMLVLSPSVAMQSMTATPPLETPAGGAQATQEVVLSDRPQPSASEMPNNGQTQTTQDTQQAQDNTSDDVTKEKSESEKNETLEAPGEGHMPTPAWDSPARADDPYAPGDFVSRRFLQSDMVDPTPEMQDNMKNEQAEEELEKAEGEGQEQKEEPGEEEETAPLGDERPEPEGQEDPATPEDEIPESVTPAMSDDDPMPPFASEEDTAIPTPPTVSEDLPTEEETSQEGGTGIVGNFVSALDGALQFVDPLVGAVIGILPGSVGDFLAHEPFGVSAPRAALISLFVFSFFTLFTVSYCMALCGGKRRDPLAKVSALEDKLFVTSKERDELLQTVDKLQVEIQDARSRSSKSEGEQSDLGMKLKTVQLHTSALKQTASTQEVTIKDLTAQNAELTNIIAEKDGQLEQLMYQVAQLQEQFNTANMQLQESWQAQTVAQTQTSDLSIQVEQLTEEVTILTQSKDQLQLQLEGWNEKVGELTDELALLKDQQKENEKLLAFKDSEMEVMRDCFLQLKALKGATEGDQEGEQADEEEPGDGVDIQEKIVAMMDVSKVNAQLKEATEERDTMKQKLDIEVDARKQMEDEMQKMTAEMETLRAGHRAAEDQNREATTKLNVLASYFKEKEIELQTSLGEHVAKNKESQGQLLSTDERVKRAEHEMTSYRAQVDDLKKEIENVERDFRTQVAANEKKAHENWLAARQAERDLKESKNEAAMLRQKLLDLERKQEMSGPAGLIRPLPTRGMPLPGVNGPPGPGMPMGGPLPLGPSPHAMGDRPMSRGSGIPPSPHMRDELDYLPPPPLRGRPPPMMMDRPPPPPGGRMSPPPGGWGPGGRGRSPPPFDRRSPPPPFDRRSPPPPFDRRGPPPPHDRRSPPPMFRGPPPPGDRRGPLPPPGHGPLPPPGYRSPDMGYRRTPPHGRPYPPDQTPPPDYRKGGLDPRASDPRMVDPRTSSPYDRPGSSASRNTDLPPPTRSQNII